MQVGREQMGNGVRRELLTSSLGKEDRIDAPKVQIRGYEAVTNIANPPEVIEGVINPSGIIVPVVDMRLKSGWGAASMTKPP